MGAPVDRSLCRGSSFVGYLQTHDQVGNRATGDRIGATITPGQQAIGAALYLTSAFTPMVFMGEEWAASTPWQFFTDFADPELAEAVRSGRRAEFASHGWDAGDVPDPQDHATRDRSVLDWEEMSQTEHARMLSWYASLIAVRRSEPELTDDRLDAVTVASDAGAGWLVVSRGRLRVVCNVRDRPSMVPVGGAIDEVVLSWDDSTTRRTGAAMELGAHGVAIIRVG